MERGAGESVARVWAGTPRYEVIGTLGQGGMGIVYEVFDRQRKERVALKMLLNFDPAGLYRFKQEFRTLADVSHRNLVQLYELVTEHDQAFFTMELVEGTDFLEYVRGPSARGDRRETEVVTVAGAARADAPPSKERPSQAPVPRPLADFDKLRLVLCQLVEGVRAVHRAGKLHRDLKPSNVRVTPEGRVVVLDFGVATELGRGEKDGPGDDEIVGTVAYMAPEQALGEAPVAASDWYGVGAVLYEAIVGQAPFKGSTLDVLTMKNTVDPLPPSQCTDQVPPELDALCCELLHRDPAKRPDGAEILERLGATRSVPSGTSVSVPPTAQDGAGHTRLFGRDADLRALHEAFASTRAGRTVTVRVSGEPGVGKSAVVHRFLDEVVEQQGAVTLRGRAYEREAVPYKAVDSMIDALSRYLLQLDEEDPAFSVPEDTWALARLFPVLRRVPRIAALGEKPIADPHRVRRRAFVALRELLAALATRAPLVLFVDDAQWGDVDSAALLLELVRPPQAASLLIVMTYRERDDRVSPFLGELRARWWPGAETRDWEVGPLDERDARRLAFELLDSYGEAAESVASAVGRESGGNPFLIEELARNAGALVQYESERSVASAIAFTSLDQMVTRRLAALPAGARRLLEVVALGGRPVRVSVAAKASGFADRADEAVALLRAHRFLRAGLRDGQEVLEVVQDRIRETIVGRLSEEAARESHALIAAALEETPDADAEALATHLLRAGEKLRAAQFAERAAEQAAHQLAFDQAARLLRLAAESHPASTTDGRRLRKRLGEVLDWAGRCAESAQVYLEATEGASGLEKLDLQRVAAEQFCASGHMAQGARVLHGVLEAVGLRAPQSALAAMVWLIVYRFWLRVVPLRFRERTLTPEERLRLDALCAAGLGFTLVDVALGFSVKARLLVAALRQGDRSLTFRAATFVANDLSADGVEEGRLEKALWRMAAELGKREATPAAQFSFRITSGLTLFFRGHFKEAKEKLDALDAVLTNRKIGQHSAMLFTLYALYLMGDVEELTRRYTRLLADAEERGNLFLSVAVRTCAAAPVWLAADDPARARRDLDEALARWPTDKLSTPEWRATVFRAEVDLYAGDAATAYDRIARLRPAMRNNFYHLVQYMSAMTDFMQGRSAIASLVLLPPAQRRSRLADARGARRRLARYRTPWLAAFASILEAGIEQASGNPTGAAAALREAIHHSEAAEMALHAAASHYQLGCLLGGAEGRDLSGRAEDAMKRLGVAAPARYASMLVPGAWKNAAPAA